MFASKSTVKNRISTRLEEAKVDAHSTNAEIHMPVTIRTDKEASNLTKNFFQSFQSLSRKVKTSGPQLNMTRIESQRGDSNDGTNGLPSRSIEISTTISIRSSKSTSALSFFTFSFNLLFTAYIFTRLST
jgi:hypothetical protein